jgi:anti-anti-sigma factor
MAFKLISIDRDGIVRVGADGNLTWREVKLEGGENPLAKLLGANWAQMRVLFDMNDVGYIDSATVGWLIESQKNIKTAGGKLVLYRVQPQVKQVFDLLRVGRVITMTADESEARAKAQEETATA